MATQNVGVRFNVGVTGTGQAAAGLSKVQAKMGQVTSQTKSLAGGFGGARMAGINFNRVVQDAPFGLIAIQNNIDPLVQSFIALRQSTGSTGGAIKAFLGAFKGASGVLMLINLAVAGFTAYAMATRGAGKDTESLEKSVSALNGAFKSLVKIENPFEKMQASLKPEQLQGALDIFNKRLETSKKNVENVGKAFSGALPGLSGLAFELGIKDAPTAEDLQTSVNVNQAIVTGLKEQIQKQKALTDVMIALRNEGIKPTTERSLKLKSGFFDIAKGVDKATESIKGFTTLISPEALTGLGGIGDKAPLNEAIFSREQLQRDFAEINMVAKTAANALRNAFMGVWDDIFGHADNLFTKFLRDIVAGLAQIAAQRAATSIFDFLLTGLGIGLAPVTGGGSLIASGVGSLIPGGGSPNTSITVVQIGDQEIARVVNNGQNRANRLRLPTNQRAF